METLEYGIFDDDIASDIKGNFDEYISDLTLYKLKTNTYLQHRIIQVGFCDIFILKYNKSYGKYIKLKDHKY